jgi:hypothetical protein
MVTMQQINQVDPGSRLIEMSHKNQDNYMIVAFTDYPASSCQHPLDNQG